MNRLSYMDQNFEEINARIRGAEARVGREGVRLVAAVKYTDAEHINYLHRELGVHDVGENRVQQLLEHWETVDREGLNFHFIGKLQTNKVKYIADKVDCIQSLDSDRLAREIEKQCAKIGRVMDVLIEINSGNEEAKSGIAPEEVKAFAHRVVSGEYPHLALKGFMTMAPKSTEEEYRVIFRKTRLMCESLWSELPMADEPMVMSMGMSESYIPAAAEGATMVRVGRGLFQKPDINE